MCYELKLKSESKRITLYRVYTRELDGVPVTKCLPYIYLANSPYYTNLAYLKGICVLYAINIWYDIIALEPSMSFYDYDL